MLVSMLHLQNLILLIMIELPPCGRVRCNFGTRCHVPKLAASVRVCKMILILRENLKKLIFPAPVGYTFKTHTPLPRLSFKPSAP